MIFPTIFVLFLVIVNDRLSAADHPAHLKLFGSSGPSVNIEEIHQEFPTVSKLFNYHISQGKPGVFRQVLNQQGYFDLWQSDEELLNSVYGLGKTSIYVQSFKSKSGKPVQMTFGEFLERYKTEPLIFADYVPEVLRKFLIVPPPLQCEAVLETFQSAIMLMNHVYASPLLYSDTIDQIYCVLRGQKRFVLVDGEKYPKVLQIVTSTQRKSSLNFDRVDLNQHPAFIDVEYHQTNLSSGDCLFIPNNWIYHDRSLESTITIVLQIDHQQATMIDAKDIETCLTNHTYDDQFTFDQIDWSENQGAPNLKELMMKLIKKNIQGLEKWQKIFSKHLGHDLVSDPDVSSIFEEFYGIVDVDGDGEVTLAEIEQINGIHQHHISDILYEMGKTIHEKRKGDTAKSTDTPEENLNEDEDEASETDRTEL